MQFEKLLHINKVTTKNVQLKNDLLYFLNGRNMQNFTSYKVAELDFQL